MIRWNISTRFIVGTTASGLVAVAVFQFFDMKAAILIVCLLGLAVLLADFFLFSPARQRAAILRLNLRPRSCGETFFDHPEILAKGEAERKFVTDACSVIAQLGCLEDGVLEPNDTFAETLVELPFWDSMDLMEYFIELEEKNGIQFFDKEIQRHVTGKFTSSDYTLARFIGELLNIVREKEKEKNSEVPD